MFFRKTILITFALLAALALAPAARLESKGLDCLECHEQLTAGSVHAETASCAECHPDVVDDSHEDKGARPVNCGNCHEELAETMARDIHQRMAKQKGKETPTCVTCHGSHKITPPGDSRNRVRDYCSGCHENLLLVNPFHSLGKVPNEVCLECHENAVIFPDQLAGSVHNQLLCSDCHAYSATHLERHQQEMPFDQVADCYLCHAKEALEHRESIHGISITEGIDEAANCWNCHGSHAIAPVASEGSPVQPGNQANTCGKCHDNPKITEKFAMSVKLPGKMYSRSVHGELVKHGRMDAATCVLCHGVHSVKNRVQPGSPISSFAVPETCGKCHQEITAAYQQSIHWVRAKRGIKDAPVCNDCHSEHSIHAINSAKGNGESRRIQEETCFKCHADPIIARRYNLNPQRAESYRDSYHGMAEQRGDENVALCADCHGIHKILPLSHPESSVNPEHVVGTCQKCHPNTNATFASSYTHEKSSPSIRAVEYWVELIYIWVIWVVIGGMALHNLLILGVELRRRRRLSGVEISIPRFNINEVVQHLLLTLAFLTLAVSGFALTFPDAWGFQWLEWLHLTEQVRRYVHRSAGVVLIGLGLYHVVYLAVTQRGRLVVRALWPRLADLRGFFANMAYYLGMRRNPPDFAEFDYAEKMEYWALIWGTLIMGVTGIVLWFPAEAARSTAGWLIPVSTLIHFYEAVLATLAILVWHWFFVIFHPRSYPMNFTMVDGRISLADYKHHHRDAFNRLVLEWYRLDSGFQDPKTVSTHTRRILEALERSGHSPLQFFRKELDRDADLKTWIVNHAKNG